MNFMHRNRPHCSQFRRLRRIVERVPHRLPRIVVRFIGENKAEERATGREK